MLKSIRSLKNPLIKQIIQLQDKARTRKELGVFIIEGGREIKMALEGGFTIQTILYGEHLSTYYDVEKLLLWTDKKPEIIEMSREVHQRLFVRETTESLIAIAEVKENPINSFKLPEKKNVLILVAESPEKPGNIGALLRTADGAGVDAVFIADPKTDLYNANVIRASLGCIFTLQIYSGTTLEIIEILKKEGVSIYCAYLEASQWYNKVVYEDKTAIVVGAEDKGLSREWIEKSHQNIVIPMKGKVDSLNVSVSTGILLYEVVGQRSE
ncbi:MAG: RNA methyltransferase [Saprospiraceae bacterium]|nr:RNA methyltransferase [Saprospiraceae bacterium]MBK7524895.1 RNA methyltransferase [Saprospiraceae bacterium]MBK8817944.1 RNA methyltransferase [Saprospiraceae bacterium]MBK9042881.1 RNA methyltransferase [Saprospiraceae bacterium]